MLEEGWRAAWCYSNRARSLLPTKAKRKRARKRGIQGQAEAQLVAVLMPEDGSPGNVNPAGVTFSSSSYCNESPKRAADDS